MQAGDEARARPRWPRPPAPTSRASRRSSPRPRCSRRRPKRSPSPPAPTLPTTMDNVPTSSSTRACWAGRDVGRCRRHRLPRRQDHGRRGQRQAALRHRLHADGGGRRALSGLTRGAGHAAGQSATAGSGEAQPRHAPDQPTPRPATGASSRPCPSRWRSSPMSSPPRAARREPRRQAAAVARHHRQHRVALVTEPDRRTGDFLLWADTAASLPRLARGHRPSPPRIGLVARHRDRPDPLCPRALAPFVAVSP